MSADILFDPLRLGAIELRNRIVMAPMTRMRAGPGHAPTPLNAEYYAQRASAGMIVTEGTAVSPQAQGFPECAGHLHRRPDRRLARDRGCRPRPRRQDRDADRA